MSVPGPVLGPCEAWISGSDVAACPPCDGVGTDPSVLDTVALEASMALFEISGRRFTGLCEKQVRPCQSACSCWSGLSCDYYWADSWGGQGWVPMLIDGAWTNWRTGNGGTCGCEPVDSIPLAGYPVREVTEVLIDGEVLEELDVDGNPNWELRGWDRLVRLDSPGPPVVRRHWPGCQNMRLVPPAPGTFKVTYRHGVDPPQLGRDAAALVACQLFLSCAGRTSGCVLPPNVTAYTRQGVQVDQKGLLNWFASDKSTGLVPLDLFLRSYSATGKQRAPAVWSPDLPAFPERIT